jgi:hypothetical protein
MSDELRLTTEELAALAKLADEHTVDSYGTGRQFLGRSYEPVTVEGDVVARLVAEVRQLRGLCDDVETKLAAWEGLRAFPKGQTYAEVVRLRKRLREARQ